MAEELDPKQKYHPEVDGEVNEIFLLSFSGGQRQMEEETDQLHALLHGKLTKEESCMLLRRTKALLIIAEDKSETRITTSIIVSTDKKLTGPEAHLVYKFLTGVSGPIISGGDGSSAEKAVIINTTSSTIGINEEYLYIERVCGKRDVDWTFEMQMLAHQNGREYDIVTIKMKDGSVRGFWFDITSFLEKS